FLAIDDPGDVVVEVISRIEDFSTLLHRAARRELPKGVQVFPDSSPVDGLRFHQTTIQHRHQEATIGFDMSGHALKDSFVIFVSWKTSHHIVQTDRSVELCSQVQIAAIACSELDLFSDTGFLGRLSCSPDKALNEVYPNNPIAAFRKLDGVPTNAAPSVQQRRSWLKTQLRDDTIDLSGRVLHPLVRRIKEHSRIGFLDNAILIRKQLLQILNGQAALRLGPEGDCKPFHAGTQRAEWPGILVHTESLQLFRDSGVVYE